MLYVGLIFLVIVLGRAEQQVKSQMAWRRVGQKFCSQEELVSSVGLSTTTRDQILYLMGSWRSHVKMCVRKRGKWEKHLSVAPTPHWPTVHPKE